MTVTSKENPQVKKWRQLSADGRTRRKENAFAVEGARLCHDAAVSGVCITVLLYTETAKTQYAEAFGAIAAVAEGTMEIADALAKYMSQTTTPQGMFCICKMPTHPLSVETLSPNGRYLALEDVRDPANVGTVIRTAEALGLDGILLSAGCCDLYNPKVLRGSMGGVFRLPFAVMDYVPADIALLRDKGFCAYACVPDSSAVSICDIPLKDGAICFIGNEANGLTQETIAACDTVVTIPMAGRAESLNAAMAAGIVMWEMKRGN